jgi:hypothetical protein
MKDPTKSSTENPNTNFSLSSLKFAINTCQIFSLSRPLCPFSTFSLLLSFPLSPFPFSLPAIPIPSLFSLISPSLISPVLSPSGSVAPPSPHLLSHRPAYLPLTIRWISPVTLPLCDRDHACALVSPLSPSPHSHRTC